jgi:hypothetical protein
MDNVRVYNLDNLTKNELKKKGGRTYALFVDFRAAFDKVDREKMFECMREGGMLINGWFRRLRRYAQ